MRRRLCYYGTIEALLFGGKTAALFEGSLVQFGPTSKIYREPINLVSAKVFSEPPINICKVQKIGSNLKVSDAEVWNSPKKFESIADAEYTLGIRPHHVTPDARVILLQNCRDAFKLLKLAVRKASCTFSLISKHGFRKLMGFIRIRLVKMLNFTQICHMHICLTKMGNWFAYEQISKTIQSGNGVLFKWLK